MKKFTLQIELDAGTTTTSYKNEGLTTHEIIGVLHVALASLTESVLNPTKGETKNDTQ